MSRNGRSRPTAGFSLIEVLVALAVVITTLSVIGGVIAMNVRRSRGIEDRLALAGIAETLMGRLADRATLRPGSTSGETSGYRWRMDVTAAPIAAAQSGAAFTPFAVVIRLEARGGATLQVNTLRLLSTGRG